MVSRTYDIIKIRNKIHFIFFYMVNKCLMCLRIYFVCEIFLPFTNAVGYIVGRKSMSHAHFFHFLKLFDPITGLFFFWKFYVIKITQWRLIVWLRLFAKVNSISRLYCFSYLFLKQNCLEITCSINDSNVTPTVMLNTISWVRISDTRLSL